jgi:hypothetical protein
MSMDLEVWSENPFDLETMLNNPDQWEIYGDEWAYEGDGWQVTINLSSEAQLPDTITQKMPSAKYVAYITLEPIGAEINAYQYFEKTVRALARGSKGLWIDPYGSAFCAEEGAFE